MSKASSRIASTAFPTLSKVPWQWAVYVTIYALVFNFSDKFSRYEDEIALGLLVSSPALWLLEIITLKPSTRSLLFSFSGRAPRSMYGMILIVGFTGASVWGVGWTYINFHSDVFLGELLLALLVLTAPLLPIWALAAVSIEVRRWHDLNRSGWFYLTNLIPFAQLITYPYLFFFRGTWGKNNYGEDPLSHPDDRPYSSFARLNVASSVFFIAFNWVAFKCIL